MATVELSRAARAFRFGHAAIAVAFLLAIGYVWWCALTGRRDRRLRLAIVALATEGAFVAANRGDCPLWRITGASRRSGAPLRTRAPPDRRPPSGTGAWGGYSWRSSPADAPPPGVQLTDVRAESPATTTTRFPLRAKRSCLRGVTVEKQYPKPRGRTAQPSRRAHPRRSGAERVGFEPTRQFDPPTRFPVVHLKPLGHLSGADLA
jgi:hypothetical protein